MSAIPSSVDTPARAMQHASTRLQSGCLAADRSALQLIVRDDIDFVEGQRLRAAALQAPGDSGAARAELRSEAASLVLFPS